MFENNPILAPLYQFFIGLYDFILSHFSSIGIFSLLLVATLVILILIMVFILKLINSPSETLESLQRFFILLTNPIGFVKGILEALALRSILRWISMHVDEYLIQRFKSLGYIQRFAFVVGFLALGIFIGYVQAFIRFYHKSLNFFLKIYHISISYIKDITILLGIICLSIFIGYLLSIFYAKMILSEPTGNVVKLLFVYITSFSFQKHPFWVSLVAIMIFLVFSMVLVQYHHSKSQIGFLVILLSTTLLLIIIFLTLSVVMLLENLSMIIYVKNITILLLGILFLGICLKKIYTLTQYCYSALSSFEKPSVPNISLSDIRQGIVQGMLFLPALIQFLVKVLKEVFHSFLHPSLFDSSDVKRAKAVEEKAYELYEQGNLRGALTQYKMALLLYNRLSLTKKTSKFDDARAEIHDKIDSIQELNEIADLLKEKEATVLEKKETVLKKEKTVLLNELDELLIKAENNYEMADDLYYKALEIAEKVLGYEHLSTIRIRDTLNLLIEAKNNENKIMNLQFH